MGNRRILVYWDYRRRDLLLPFDKLDYYFEWYFIFFSKEEVDVTSLKYKKLYWSNYSTPYDLLKYVNPHCVIFSDLSNVNTVSLNIACKNINIKTYLLEHGVKLYYDYYLEIEKLSRNLNLNNGRIAKKSKGGNIQRIQTLKFYFSAIRFKNYKDIINIFKLFYNVFIIKSDKAFMKARFSI